RVHQCKLIGARTPCIQRESATPRQPADQRSSEPCSLNHNQPFYANNEGVVLATSITPRAKELADSHVDLNFRRCRWFPLSTKNFFCRPARGTEVRQHARNKTETHASPLTAKRRSVAFNTTEAPCCQTFCDVVGGRRPSASRRLHCCPVGSPRRRIATAMMRIEREPRRRSS